MHDRTESLDTGLYEALITAELELRLARLDDRLTVNRSDLHRAEVADRIALHLSRVIGRVLASRKDEDRVQFGVQVARELLGRLDNLAGTTEGKLETPVQPAAILEAIVDRLPDEIARA